MEVLTLDAIQKSAFAQYEDLVWKVAETSDKDLSEVTSPSEYGVILHLAEKSLKDFVEDIASVRRRLELKGEIDEFTSAQKEKAVLVEQRNDIQAEFAEIKKTYDNKLAVVRANVDSVERRISNTADARKYYRTTAPGWLRDRFDAIDQRLWRLKMLEEESGPRKPADLTKSLLRPNVHDRDNDVRAREEKYEEQLAKYEDALDQHKRKLAKRAKERKALESERATLEVVALKLRPVPEDAQCTIQN